MSYIINGPTIIGDAANGNTLQGTLTLPQVCTATGDLIYSSNAGGLMTRLPIGTAGQVLKVVAGLPSWQTDTSSIDDGFSAVLTANQAIAAATPTNLQGFSATAPGFDTSGGWFAAGQAAGDWTPGTIGKYRVSANVAFTNDTTNVGTRTVTLLINNTAYLVKDFQSSGNISIAQQLNFSTSVSLTATDNVEIELNSTNGAITVLAAGTNVSITRYA